MSDRHLLEQALKALDSNAVLNVGAIKDALRDRLAQPEQEPVVWECKAGGLKRLSQRLYEKQPDNIKRHYTRIEPPQRKPDYKSFMEWASKEGYDTAYTINSDNGKFMPLNPMTADLWKAWQAAHGIKGEA